MNEGKQNSLNVWLREQSHESKYLALLTYPTLAELDQAVTLSTMRELFPPGMNGYARQQVFARDWAEPELDKRSGDYVCVATEKFFGPATVPWDGITHVALVTAPVGVDGKFLFSVPLPRRVGVGVDQRYGVTLTTRAR